MLLLNEHLPLWHDIADGENFLSMTDKLFFNMKFFVPILYLEILFWSGKTTNIFSESNEQPSNGIDLWKWFELNSFNFRVTGSTLYILKIRNPLFIKPIVYGLIKNKRSEVIPRIFLIGLLTVIHSRL